MGQYYIYSVQCSYRYNITSYTFFFNVFFVLFVFVQNKSAKINTENKSFFDTVIHGVEESVCPCKVVIIPSLAHFFYRIIKKNVFGAFSSPLCITVIYHTSTVDSHVKLSCINVQPLSFHYWKHAVVYSIWGQIFTLSIVSRDQQLTRGCLYI